MVVPVAGLASRMGAAVGAAPKCLSAIDGTTILDRLVSAAAATGHVRALRLVVPPRQPHLEHWIHDAMPHELVEASPEPVGRTLLRAVHDDEDVLTLDGDLVIADGGLQRFVTHVATTADPASLSVALSTDPWSLGERTLWWHIEGDGVPRIRRGGRPGQARLAGIYHLRPAALAALRVYEASGATSFGAFFCAYPGAEMVGIDVGFCYDCNTPDELAQAAARLAGSRPGLGSRTLSP